jgi:acetate kinase
MHVLALNPGSATLKFRLYALGDGEQELAAGTVEHVSGEATMARAVEGVVNRCLPLRIDAVGCRVVHGGDRFSGPALVTEEVLAGIEALVRLAPLHNPVALAALEGCRRLLPGEPAVAVFDTAFHRTLPDVAALYALPLEWSTRLGLRRYGFHGLSHRYVAEQLLARLGRGPEGARLIVCHLGNGASVCAVRDGRSVDTSMGLTPLEGLIMGTRSGDVDPGLVLHLLTAEGMTAAQVDDLLNHQSGLLGLGGSGDVRELQRAVDGGDGRARLALEAFAYRVRKYVGAYTAALGGLDALAFTGGIGEHSALVRGLVVQDLECLGVRVEAARNERVKGQAERISADGSPVAVWVVPTDEEKQIARETAALVAQPGRASAPGGSGME